MVVVQNLILKRIIQQNNVTDCSKEIFQERNCQSCGHKIQENGEQNE